MRKEYGNIFTGKYYWEYNESCDISWQALRKSKGDNLVSIYKDSFSLPSSLVSKNIINQFQKDVDDHFAELDRQKQKYICIDHFMTNSLSDPKFIQRGTIISQFDYDFYEQYRKYFKLIDKPTGDNKMKLEIYNKEEETIKLTLEEVRTNIFSVRARRRSLYSIVCLDGDDKEIRISKQAADELGFKIRII